MKRARASEKEGSNKTSLVVLYKNSYEILLKVVLQEAKLLRLYLNFFDKKKI